jgi:hypothetical protein
MDAIVANWLQQNVVASTVANPNPSHTPAPPHPHNLNSSPNTIKSISASKSNAHFDVMCYNILADMYAGRPQAQEELYSYCDPALLQREYRNQMLLGELLAYNADIMCLQELETGGFDRFFKPTLAERGYFGVHAPKRKGGEISPEGCATFFKEARFQLVKATTVSFHAAVDDPLYADLFGPYLAKPELLDVFRRVNSVGQATLLQEKEDDNGGGGSDDGDRGGSSSGGGGNMGDGGADGGADVAGSGGRRSRDVEPRQVLVLNTHLFFHPAAPHVRAIQLAVLLRAAAAELAEQPRNTALLLCGDLNSTPETGVVEFLMTGAMVRRFYRVLFLFVFSLSLRRQGRWCVV